MHFGIGLRLSNLASIELLENNHLLQFKDWLVKHDLYVFTMNGFPYGGFHGIEVKENVHSPDWRTKERLNYTLRLFNILSELLPAGTNGGISTSPLTYKHWLKNEEEKQEAFVLSTRNFLEIAATLHKIHQTTGQILHLDIEPEPDGLLENTKETIDFFKIWLCSMAQMSGIFPKGKAEDIVLRHINVCYDVCHFAIEYEEPIQVFQAFKENGIQIGKIQISAALKADLPKVGERGAIYNAFEQFNESTYLHQVIARSHDNSTTNFNDLPLALAQIDNKDFVEWRTHFHVPIFVDNYGRIKFYSICNSRYFRYPKSYPNH